MISVRSNWPVLLLVDAEIGRQLHRAAHARRHIDERAVGEHRRIERGKEIVVTGTTVPRYFFTSSGCSWTASEIGMKITPALASSGLEGGGHRNRIEHRVDRDAPLAAGAPIISGRTTPSSSASCSRSGMPSFS
jgi:hypothetical protein